MKRSTDRILTTHTGSLPRTPRVVELLLAQSGLQITFAENGKEAVEKFSHGRFDLVLMDRQMPVVGGLEATATIRDAGRASGTHLPIVALTAHARRNEQGPDIATGRKFCL